MNNLYYFTPSCESYTISKMREKTGREGGREGKGMRERGRKEGWQGGRVRNTGPVFFAAVVESSSGHEVWYLQHGRVHTGKHGHPLGVADGCPVGPGGLLLLI